MKTIVLSDSTMVTLYRSARELPIGLYGEFQKFLMQDAGLGSDYQSVINHFEKLETFLMQGNTAAALQETKNLHLNMIHNLEKISIDSLSFGCLVHSIDSTKVKDYSEAGIKDMMAGLSDSGLTQADVEDIINDVKKNLKRI